MTTDTALKTLRKIAFITAKPGMEDALSAALVDIQAKTLAESGCRLFHFYRSLTQRDAFFLNEEFDDADALRQHMDQPYIKAFFAAGLVAAVQVTDL